MRGLKLRECGEWELADFRLWEHSLLMPSPCTSQFPVSPNVDATAASGLLQVHNLQGHSIMSAVTLNST